MCTLIYLRINKKQSGKGSERKQIVYFSQQDISLIHSEKGRRVIDFSVTMFINGCVLLFTRKI